MGCLDEMGRDEMSVSGFLQSLIMTGHSPGTITIRASIRQTVGTSQKFASGNHVRYQSLVAKE